MPVVPADDSLTSDETVTLSETIFLKTIDPSRYEYLFVLVGDGRQWFIPAAQIMAKTMVLLGGPKYAAFEVG